MALPPETLANVTDAQAAELVNATLKIAPRAVARQILTKSGNFIFRVTLADGRDVVLRVSPQRRAYAYTAHNLDSLGALGLPVQKVLAAGPTALNGSFIILNWVPGRDLLHELPQMTPGQMTRAAQSITDYQKRIGTLPPSKGFGWAPIGKNANMPTWSEIFGQPLALEAPPDAPLIEQLRGRLRTLRAGIEPYFATVKPICFLDDLTLTNVVMENGELRGIIDVDMVCFGDPLMSVGSTLASVAADVGKAGQFYAEELIRSWAPSENGQQAICFYAALWAIGFLYLAQSDSDVARAEALAPVADAMLRRGGV